MLTLALGIGANTTIFSVIDNTLLKPLPFPDSGRLVLLCKPTARVRTIGGSSRRRISGIFRKEAILSRAWPSSILPDGGVAPAVDPRLSAWWFVPPH
jgi:hypothetical protein